MTDAFLGAVGGFRGILRAALGFTKLSSECEIPFPKGPNLEKIQDRLKFSILLENSRSLEIFNPDLQNSPQKIGVWWVARLKISSSLEIFKILNFFNLWALRVLGMASHDLSQFGNRS